MKATAETFWRKVDRSGGPDSCWLWKGYLQDGLYGRCSFQGKMVLAHRLAWELTNGQIAKTSKPHDVCVLHRCDVTACVNPRHLFLGSQAINVADMCKKHRDFRGQPQRGATNPQAKLSAVQARSIFADSRHFLTIADEYGVSGAAVRDIKTGRRWAHITASHSV